MKWLDKDPDEIDYRDIDWTLRLYNEAERLQYEAALALDPSLEFTPRLAVVPADTLQSSTFTLPPPLTAGPPSTYTQFETRVWFSASGVAGESYDVLNRVTTALGRTLDQTVKLKIKSK